MKKQNRIPPIVQPKNEFVEILEMIPALVKTFKEKKHEIKMSVTGKQLEELGKLTAKWEREDE